MRPWGKLIAAALTALAIAPNAAATAQVTAAQNGHHRWVFHHAGVLKWRGPVLDLRGGRYVAVTVNGDRYPMNFTDRLRRCRTQLASRHVLVEANACPGSVTRLRLTIAAAHSVRVRITWLVAQTPAPSGPPDTTPGAQR